LRKEFESLREVLLGKEIVGRGERGRGERGN